MSIRPIGNPDQNPIEVRKVGKGYEATFAGHTVKLYTAKGCLWDRIVSLISTNRWSDAFDSKRFTPISYTGHNDISKPLYIKIANISSTIAEKVLSRNGSMNESSVESDPSMISTNLDGFLAGRRGSDTTTDSNPASLRSSRGGSVETAETEPVEIDSSFPLALASENPDLELLESQKGFLKKLTKRYPDYCKSLNSESKREIQSLMRHCAVLLKESKGVISDKLKSELFIFKLQVEKLEKSVELFEKFAKITTELEFLKDLKVQYPAFHEFYSKENSQILERLNTTLEALKTGSKTLGYQSSHEKRLDKVLGQMGKLRGIASYYEDTQTVGKTLSGILGEKIEVGEFNLRLKSGEVITVAAALEMEEMPDELMQFHKDLSTLNKLISNPDVPVYLDKEVSVLVNSSVRDSLKSELKEIIKTLKLSQEQPEAHERFKAFIMKVTLPGTGGKVVDSLRAKLAVFEYGFDCKVLNSSGSDLSKKAALDELLKKETAFWKDFPSDPENAADSLKKVQEGLEGIGKAFDNLSYFVISEYGVDFRTWFTGFGKEIYRKASKLHLNKEQMDVLNSDMQRLKAQFEKLSDKPFETLRARLDHVRESLITEIASVVGNSSFIESLQRRCLEKIIKAMPTNPTALSDIREYESMLTTLYSNISGTLSLLEDLGTLNPEFMSSFERMITNTLLEKIDHPGLVSDLEKPIESLRKVLVKEKIEAFDQLIGRLEAKKKETADRCHSLSLSAIMPPLRTLLGAVKLDTPEDLKSGIIAYFDKQIQQVTDLKEARLSGPGSLSKEEASKKEINSSIEKLSIAVAQSLENERVSNQTIILEKTPVITGILQTTEGTLRDSMISPEILQSVFFPEEVSFSDTQTILELKDIFSKIREELASVTTGRQIHKLEERANDIQSKTNLSIQKKISLEQFEELQAKFTKLPADARNLVCESLEDLRKSIIATKTDSELQDVRNVIRRAVARCENVKMTVTLRNEVLLMARQCSSEISGKPTLSALVEKLKAAASTSLEVKDLNELREKILAINQFLLIQPAALDKMIDSMSLELLNKAFPEQLKSIATKTAARGRYAGSGSESFIKGSLKNTFREVAAEKAEILAKREVSEEAVVRLGKFYTRFSCIALIDDILNVVPKAKAEERAATEALKKFLSVLVMKGDLKGALAQVEPFLSEISSGPIKAALVKRLEDFK